MPFGLSFRDFGNIFGFFIISLHYILFYPQSAFYPWSAVCILPLVCSLHFTLSLHFTPGLQSAFYTDRFAFLFINLFANLLHVQ